MALDLHAITARYKAAHATRKWKIGLVAIVASAAANPPPAFRPVIPFH